MDPKTSPFRTKQRSVSFSQPPFQPRESKTQRRNRGFLHYPAFSNFPSQQRCFSLNLHRLHQLPSIVTMPPKKSCLLYLITMRRQGQYDDPSPNTYATAQMHNMAGQRMETKSGNFEGRLEAFTPERENPYTNSKPEGQWRWDLDGSSMSNSMASHVFNEGRGGDVSRSYFQGQRTDLKLVLQNQSNNDTRSQAHEENMDVGYEGNHLSQTFEGLEQKFLDDIMKLAKEQNDAEDAENSRHREKINAINAQYEENLAALRAQQASRRDEFFRRESHARQHQYQQSIMDPYPSSGMAPSDPHGYSAVNASAAVGEVQRGYGTADHFDPYRERARFLGAARDQGFEPRGPYPGGRVYDTGSRYYK